jgi:broad specificity phosphatase PhoE
MATHEHQKVVACRELTIAGLPRFRAAGADEEDGASQHIYLIRHGEAAHNVQGRPWGPELIDAKLTPRGREQALSELRSAAESLPLELVVVSPLTRAIETALLGLAPHLEVDDDQLPLPPPQQQQQLQGRRRRLRPVAIEQCREQFGQNLPDRRRTTAELRAEFPTVDFAAHAMAEEDELFTPERETLEALALRADAFLEVLSRRPERHIAVVTHSSFLAALCNSALDTRGASCVSPAPALGSWFANAEMRLVRLVRSTSGLPPPTS